MLITFPEMWNRNHLCCTIFVFWILFNGENQMKQTTVCRRRDHLVRHETVLVYENQRIHHLEQTQCLESLIGKYDDDEDRQWQWTGDDGDGEDQTKHES